jgi:hypothetical protein
MQNYQAMNSSNPNGLAAGLNLARRSRLRETMNGSGSTAGLDVTKLGASVDETQTLGAAFT